MKFDIFFSICQTEVDGYLPSEETMFRNFFDQVELADQLRFDTAWIAESHLSCEVQKGNPNPVIPHFKGEIGLNTDIFQLAHLIFERTKNIQVGSAIRNILCNGGPIAQVESLKTFLSLHRLRPEEKRKFHLGFAAGRFPFANEPYGIKARNELEETVWPVLKGKIFSQAAEIFFRLLKGEALASKDITPIRIAEVDFRTDEEWQKAVELAKKQGDISIEIPTYWDFEKLGVIPKLDDLSLLQLVIGSHDPATQVFANKYFPTWVFNLSITPSKKIEATNQLLADHFHPDGGEWKREYMPRTALLFVNGDPDLSPAEQSAKAKIEAKKAVGNYRKAIEGTFDPQKLEEAVENSIFGNPDEVAQKIVASYHKDDRLMLWFDFNNHDNKAVKKSMQVFAEQVKPKIVDMTK